MAEALSGATGALQGSVGGMLNKGSAWLDSIFPPEKRNELMAMISKFATEKPMLAVRTQAFTFDKGEAAAKHLTDQIFSLS